MSESIKIFFAIEPDEDGYPEVGSESVWATPTTIDGAYVIDNIPFFSRDANLGDTVSTYIEGNVRWFKEVIKFSPNSLFRVFCYDQSIVTDVAADLTSLGCVSEYSGPYNLLAVSVPEGKVFDETEAYLNKKRAEGILDVEGAIYRS